LFGFVVYIDLCFFFPHRGLVEIAMHKKCYDFVDDMVAKMSMEDFKDPVFLERFRIYHLHRWIDRDNYEAEDPEFILAILNERTDDEGVISQAAAQILQAKVKKNTSMTTFYKMVDQTFPNEDRFDAEKGKLIELGKEFDSPTKVITAMAKKKPMEFSQSIRNLANSMERALPPLEIDGVVVEEPYDDEDEDEEEREDFTAQELLMAFAGSQDAWESVVLQDDDEVKQFLHVRNGRPKSARRSAKKHKKYIHSDGEDELDDFERGSSSAVKSEPPRKATRGTYAAPVSEKKGKGKRKKIATPKSLASRKSKTPATDGRKHRVRWSEEETLFLVMGVRKHGAGRWKDILMDETLEFEAVRTNADLKDKWRNIEKKRSHYDEILNLRAREKARGGKKRDMSEEEEEIEEIDDSDREVVETPKSGGKDGRSAMIEARNKRIKQQEQMQ
jgi:hypothetical protein